MSKTKSFQVEFQPTGKRIALDYSGNLMEAARNSGIDLASACGGLGNCGQCQVNLLSGEVSAPTSDEEFILSKFDILEGRRLACCVQVYSDSKVEIPRGSLVTGQRLQIESNLKDIEVDPIVRAFQLRLTPPSLTDTRSDITRIVEALSISDLTVSPATIHTVSKILREENWRISAFVHGKRLIGISPFETQPLGYAVDLGTTKIAAYLIDLESGKELASAGAPNPQIGYGEDVISRLFHVHSKPEAGEILAQKVQKILDELLGELISGTDMSREQVVEACVVGNTAMIHLFLQLPVSQLAKAPYVAAINEAMDIPSRDLGIHMASGASIHIPPCIGGFVGADHVAMILACDLDQSPKISLGVDIGTNTEIAIRKPGMGFLTSISCASGPAFEGAHISEGMRAAKGAIEKVRITREGVELTTIDDELPVGLCGSGIIDVTSELFRNGIINNRGRFQKNSDKVKAGDKSKEFQLVPASGSGTSKAINISQEDINEIQLAKGAIRAGLEILLKVTKTAHEDVEEVVIAGAFGSFLNLSNAIAIGMFPDLPNAIYRQVGNAAAFGAKQILVSKLARKRAQNIQQNTQYHELTTYPTFNREFALGMLFPEPDRDSSHK